MDMSSKNCETIDYGHDYGLWTHLALIVGFKPTRSGCKEKSIWIIHVYLIVSEPNISNRTSRFTTSSSLIDIGTEIFHCRKVSPSLWWPWQTQPVFHTALPVTGDALQSAASGRPSILSLRVTYDTLRVGSMQFAEVPAFCPDSLTSMFSNVWPPIRLGIQTEAGENISELVSMVSRKYKHKNTSGLDLNLVQVHSDKSTDCQHEGQGPNGLPYCSKNPDNLAMSLALGSGSTPGLHISFLSYSCSISCKRPSRKWEKNTCRMGGFYGLRHGTFVARIARWLIATHMCESKGQAHLKVSF